MKVKIDVAGALAHLEKSTGEKLSHYQIEKEGVASRMALNNWSNGKSLKTLVSIIKLSRRTKYPLIKLIKIETK